MKEYAERFYKSKAWKHCASSYKKSVGGLCENCFQKGIIRPAVMVHHIVHLTPQNINIPEITLNYSNLEALCTDCHAARHSKGRRYTFGERGEILCVR